MALTHQEAAAIKAIKAKHDDVIKMAHVVNNQLSGIPHGNVDMESLSRAIGYEGDSIRRLMDLAKGQGLCLPDPADIEMRQEDMKEVWQEWSNWR